jgi:hypothetical protein
MLNIKAIATTTRFPKNVATLDERNICCPNIRVNIATE